MSDETACAYAAALLRETREELDRADKKASLLLAAAGVAIGALITGLLAGDWSPFELHNLVEWIWWLGVGCAAAAIAALASAVYPRIARLGPPPSVVAYFGDVVTIKSHDALKEALRDSSSLNLDRLTDQVGQVSAIVRTKYVLIRSGLQLLGAATVLCAGSVLLALAL
jgi:hypothetical protein